MDVDPDTVFPRTKIGRDHQMRDMVRHGKVKERMLDPKLGPLIKVEFLDKLDAFGLPYVSKWLPIKQTGSLKTMFTYCPKLEDFVNIKMLPNGSEDGFVDGSFYNEKNPPPADVDLDTRHFKTEDNTIIEYREKDSTFNLDASAAGGGLSQRAAGSGGIIIIKGAEVTVTAPEITLEGHMTFKGDIDHTGNMTTSGVHTDGNGIHMGGAKSDEIEDLKRRVATLEGIVAHLDNEVLNLKRRTNPWA